jgi:pyruvate/2-oxoglutarate dehydrogenase complex dihydrolipoamide dehydrogenase (E3) component
MRTFDAIVVGGGQAGPALAGRLTQSGMTVALIERKLLGGTCVNYGCMPTKTLVASARAAHVARTAGAYGVTIQGDIGIDMGTVKARADTVIHDARKGLYDWVGSMERLTFIEGHARFTGSHEIAVNDAVLTAPRIFLNVGGRPAIPDIEGLDRIDYLTSTTILALETVPRHLAILGGSYIALEFAQMYRRFGAEVTIIERGDRLASREDEDISAAIEAILIADGIAVKKGSRQVTVDRRGDDIAISIDGKVDIFASHLLVATGRTPNTSDLGLDTAGIATDRRGFITVDDRLSTTVDGVWALGDCNGRGAFTHTSYNDFEIVAANLLDGADRKVSDRITAYALYIDPPLGRVGMTEKEARATGRPIVVSSRPMSRVGRAVEKGETSGFMKAVADAETLEILGAAILGVEGDEAIHGILDMMNAKVPYPVLQWAVPIHPTVSELIPTLMGSFRQPSEQS